VGIGAPRSMSDAIVVTDLAKRFDTVDAVAGISFSVQRGELFGFLGPNGAGKSTTINLLTGLARPDAGSIRIGGIDCVRGPRAAQYLIGVVPDESNLYRVGAVVRFLEERGVVAISIPFGTTSMLAITVTFEKKGRSFERLLLAPVPLELLMLAKTGDAILFGVANACVPVVMAAFLVDLSMVAWESFVSAVFLIAIASTFLGLFIAVEVSELQQSLRCSDIGASHPSSILRRSSFGNIAAGYVQENASDLCKSLRPEGLRCHLFAGAGL
jgi:energy-coupling factor transporter ATP-binding protein EcfA2